MRIIVIDIKKAWEKVFPQFVRPSNFFVGYAKYNKVIVVIVGGLSKMCEAVKLNSFLKNFVINRIPLKHFIDGVPNRFYTSNLEIRCLEQISHIDKVHMKKIYFGWKYWLLRKSNNNIMGGGCNLTLNIISFKTHA